MRKKGVKSNIWFRKWAEGWDGCYLRWSARNENELIWKNILQEAEVGEELVCGEEGGGKDFSEVSSRVPHTATGPHLSARFLWRSPPSPAWPDGWKRAGPDSDTKPTSEPPPPSSSRPPPGWLDAFARAPPPEPGARAPLYDGWRSDGAPRRRTAHLNQGGVLQNSDLCSREIKGERAYVPEGRRPFQQRGALEVSYLKCI